MTLKQLYLDGFRNYKSQRFEFSNTVNVIRGGNAQGKTNLLEAIYYMSSARSFRAAHDRELINTDSAAAALICRAEDGGHEAELEAKLFRGAKKELWANKIKCRKASEFVGRLPSVAFAPEDLSIVRDGPSARRRLLDSALCQLRPRYQESLGEYGRLVEMKNALLRRRDGALSKQDELTADILNQRMSICGAALVSFRAAYTQRLDRLAAPTVEEISGGGEHVTLEYKTVSVINTRDDTEAMCAEKLYARLSSLLSAEKDARACLSGPHRDDITILVDGSAAKTYASQGQIRSIALALKLAEREIFWRENKSPPILLLDDVLSELDPERQDYVLNRLDAGQVFLTCCDEDMTKRLKSGRIITVCNGKSIEIDDI